jgi:hypothetical protein
MLVLALDESAVVVPALVTVTATGALVLVAQEDAVP